jgi:alginate O-acetyltransferase complex protein AlgI
MIFNSLPFVVFLVLVFALHWLPLSRSRRHQNVVLLLGSYVFYGWWDPRFLLLILFSSLVDYFVGLRLAATNDPVLRDRWLLTSVVVNLGTLFFFKYFNFFVDSFKLAFGASEGFSTLDIILPIGISFYTFQTLSYTIDIHRRQMEPTHNLLHFLTYVSFFPQLVAGPIERARTLLPQIAQRRSFTYERAVSGCRFILLGAFKKIVIADRIGPIVDTLFRHSDHFGGWLAFAGLALFFIQVYCDFSGYSDIAVGTARLFNVDLMMNFNRPFFSTSLRSFWGRWHISLMTWLRDYLYIPLGGNKGGVLRATRNVLLTFVLSGLWHGAKWNFIIWGLWHGVFLVLEQRTGMEIWRLPPLLKWALIMFPFTLSMAFFRADDLPGAMDYLHGIFMRDASLTDVIFLARRMDVGLHALVTTVVLVGLLIVLEGRGMRPEWIERFHRSRGMRYAAYAFMILLIGSFGVFTDTQAFIYFQF